MAVVEKSYRLVSVGLPSQPSLDAIVSASCSQVIKFIGECGNRIQPAAEWLIVEFIIRMYFIQGFASSREVTCLLHNEQ